MMFAKLLAFLGFAKARKWDAQADDVRLSGILEYLEGADSSIEESDYVFAERFLPKGPLAEYHKEQRALRRKYTIKACRWGLIQCAERMKKAPTGELQAWQEEERQRGKGKRRTLDPIEPAVTKEPEEYALNFKREEVQPTTHIKFPHEGRALYE